MFRWLRLRSLELKTADGLPPLPMHLSWVRDGIFVIGMDNEMQVFSQWKDTFSGSSVGTCIDNNLSSLKCKLPFLLLSVPFPQIILIMCFQVNSEMKVIRM